MTTSFKKPENDKRKSTTHTQQPEPNENKFSN